MNRHQGHVLLLVEASDLLNPALAQQEGCASLFDSVGTKTAVEKAENCKIASNSVTFEQTGR